MTPIYYRLPCPMCDFKLSTLLDMTTHLWHAHEGVIAYTSHLDYLCPLCQDELHTLPKLGQHLTERHCYEELAIYLHAKLLGVTP